MANLSNGRHGKLDREVGHGIQQIILVLKGLILLVRRPAVFCDKGVHICCDEVTASLQRSWRLVDDDVDALELAGDGGSLAAAVESSWECLGDKI